MHLQTFISLLNQSDLVQVDGGPFLHDWEIDIQDEEDLDEEIVLFSWESEGLDYSSKHTIGNIINGVFNEEDCKLVCEDHEGQETVILFFKLQKTNMKSAVQVKRWNLYHDDSLEDGEEHYNSHVMKLDDQREIKGQLYIDIQGLQNDDEDIMSVIAEINTDPRTKNGNVPCVHVHFNDDQLAVSLFKIGHRILVRPETDVEIGSHSFRVGDNGPIETFYWIE
jgi:hypothetical protein